MTDCFSLYPAYKSSDLKWVGEIPIHWQVKPAFSVVSDECIKNTDGAEDNVLSLSYGSIKRRDIETNFGLLPESFNTYQLVSEGDIILRLTDLQNDKRSLRVGHSNQRGIITSAYLKLVCKKELDDKFAYRLLHSYDTTKVFYGMGGGLRQSMKFEDFRRLPFLIPPIEEQTAIAAFLDHETAKIDTLIEKQQQLIKLLKEKRQAVISHAVTKGLNPDAPMKDSGVEWLGLVPKHWQLPKISFLAKVINGSTPDKNNRSFWIDGEIPWLASTCLNASEVISSEINITNLAYNSTSVPLIPKNSVLVGMVGQGKTRGSSSILRFDSCINQNMAAVIPKKNIYSDFLYFVFQAMYKDLRELGRGGNQAALNCEIISSLRVPAPEVKEQISIVNYINNKLEKIEKTIDSAEKQVNLLKERRTALISATVTGKIDVRNWKPESP